MGFYSVAAGTPAICFLEANTSEMRLEVISSIVDFSALKKKKIQVQERERYLGTTSMSLSGAF